MHAKSRRPFFCPANRWHQGCPIYGLGGEIMIAIKTILVPADFSDLSVPAIGYAISLAQCHHAEVIVLHVIPVEAMKQHLSAGYVPGDLVSPGEAAGGGRGHPNLERLLETKRQLLENFLAQKLGSDLLQAAKIRPLVRFGKVVEEIVATAKEEQSDLLVVTSHGPGLRRLFLGSFTDRIMRKVPCPVLTIQPSAEVRTGDDKRIPVKLIDRWAA
jgi:nucleotide-binding universal stress UspA family protein